MSSKDTTPHDDGELPPWPQVTAAFLRAHDWPSIDHEELARVIEQLGLACDAERTRHTRQAKRQTASGGTRT